MSRQRLKLLEMLSVQSCGAGRDCTAKSSGLCLRIIAELSSLICISSNHALFHQDGHVNSGTVLNNLEALSSFHCFS